MGRGLHRLWMFLSGAWCVFALFIWMVAPAGFPILGIFVVPPILLGLLIGGLGWVASGFGSRG